MRVDVYQSPKRPSWYLLVPAGKDPGSIEPQVGQEFSQARVLRTIDLLPGKGRVAVNADAALKALSQDGFCVARVGIEFTERLEGSR